MFGSVKIVVLAPKEDDETEKKDMEDIKSTLKTPKKNSKIPKKILILFLLACSGVAVYIAKPEMFTDLFQKTLEISMPSENKEDKFELTENNLPEVLINRKNQMMQETMESKKKEIEKEAEDLKKDLPIESSIKEENLPAVNFDNKSASNNTTRTSDIEEEKLPSVSFEKENISSPSVTDKKDIVNENIKKNTSADSSLLQRELSLLLKNMSFTINPKKEEISLFINNINHSIGSIILNNNKFILKDIQMNCDNEKLPVFKFIIASNDTKENLFEKEIPFSFSRKIVMSFDALSITDLENNTENIYLPEETIFKNFVLDEIKDKKTNLEFKFTCDNKKTIITGKELSEIK